MSTAVKRAAVTVADGSSCLSHVQNRALANVAIVTNATSGFLRFEMKLEVKVK